MAAENEKTKDTENIKPETDQDNTHTSTTQFGKKTVNKGYELKPEKSQSPWENSKGTNRPSKQEKYKVRNQEERGNEAKVKRDKKSPWKERSEEKHKALREPKAPNENLRSMKLKNKSNSARRKIMKSILTS